MARGGTNEPQSGLVLLKYRMTPRLCWTPILKVWRFVEDPLAAMLEVEGIQIPMEADTGAAVPLNSKVAQRRLFPCRSEFGGRKGTSQHTR